MRAAIFRGGDIVVDTLPEPVPRQGQALVKTLDPKDLLRRLAPVLSARVLGSGLRGRSVRLEVETDAERIGVNVGPGGVGIAAGSGRPDWRVTLPEIGLTQMIFGARNYADILRGMPGAEEGLPDWIGVLFPEQRPCSCLGEMF